ncbi:MAG: UDP-N-acetylmuramoyl-tripeptide--D-alanyl-D-alanine ligase [Verrucomicrobiota bacterium]|nr:UDP-N-acetylmuramoyl-tripeptide--D-alanyl-D-alanine ligase [Verrucomicrobiota bacterium]
MQTFDSNDLAQWTNGNWIGSPPERINGFCFDARLIKPGQCFVALNCGAGDGHDYIKQAIKGAAVAALVEKEQKTLPLPQLKVADSLDALGDIARAIRIRFDKPVIAVTGSCGKTTTKEMLRIVLGESVTHATKGNWNNRIGVPMTLFNLDSRKQEYAVIEAGINQPGEMALLGKMICPDLNILTNISAAHLELLGSLDNIAAEKSLLVKYADESSPVILTSKALRFPAYKDLAKRAIVLIPEGEAQPTLATKSTVSYKLCAGTQGNHILTIDQKSYTIWSTSSGIATNAALAIVAARILGIAEIDICERIESWRPSGYRGRIQKAGGQTFYIDCYNANPSSLIDSLDAFGRCAIGDADRYYILGVMNELGDAALEHHRNVGEHLALRSNDKVVFVGPELLTRAYEIGALKAGANSEQIQSVNCVKKITSSVALFEGVIFLKGSRNNHLEELLPKSF